MSLWRSEVLMECLLTKILLFATTVCVACEAFLQGLSCPGSPSTLPRALPAHVLNARRRHDTHVRAAEDDVVQFHLSTAVQFRAHGYAFQKKQSSHI